MYQLGAPQNKKKVYFENGLNKDIIKVIHQSLPAAKAEVKEFSKQFKGASNLETARNIWNYLKKLKYVKDPEGYQFIKLPKKLANSSGDCKSFSLLTGAILQNLNLPVIFRYASYTDNDPTPSHVYTITKDEQGNDIIIDGVYTKFNKEVPYKYKTDYKMQIAVINGTPAQEAAQLLNQPRIKRGFNRVQLNNQFLNKALTKVKAGGFIFNLINNELRRINNQPYNVIYSPEQLQKYLQRLKNRKSLMTVNNWVSRLLQNEINAIELNRFTGVIKFAHNDKELHGIEEEIGKLSLKKLGQKIKKISLKDVFKGVKKIAFSVPRKAFLSLVFLNVRGLAKRLSRLSDTALEQIWVKQFGGKLSVFKKAINKGAKKRPLFGASKKVKQIKGIGYAVYSSDNTVIHGIEGPELLTAGAGAAAAAATAATAANPAGAASVASIIAAAAPILVVVVKALKKAGIPEAEQPAESKTTGEIESSNFTESKTEGETTLDKISKYAQGAIEVAEKVGIIPDRPTTPTEEAVNNALPHNDTDEDKNEEAAATGGSTGNKMLIPLLIAGGAAAVYFMTKKGKK